jgi:hypothetical protein
MTIDMTYFGNGAGLVMLGFTAGMIANFFLGSFSDIRRGA